MLGVPAEIYMFGTQYAAVLLSEPLVCVVTAYVFMPVFYKLQLYSAFEVALRSCVALCTISTIIFWVFSICC